MWRPMLILLSYGFTLAASAAAPVSAAIDPDSIEIRSGAGGAAYSATQPAAMPSLGVDITRMFLALIIVIALILLARWVVKRFYQGAISTGGTRVVQVLNRTVLAPRQQVLLLQVGRRVVVVGESNGSLTTLAQIDDPDEIAQLVGKLNDENTHRSAAFGGLFGRAQRKMEDDSPSAATSETLNGDAGAADPAAEARSELSGLLEKVKSIRSQMGSQ